MERLLYYTQQLRRLPVVDPRLDTFVLAGAPNVGKSSLVSALSSGQPEVCNYPFTTKGIKMGHFFVEDRRHQVTDTPGLLPRSSEARNSIEALTIASLEHLPTAVLFVLDRDLGWYVGLSGLLQGLLVLCLLIGWRGNPVLHSLVLAVVAGRLVWEQLPGYDVDYLRAWINGRVYVNAHLYGALSGALLAVAMLLVAGRRRTTLGRRSDIC